MRVGLLTLAICACLTSARLPVWQSDLSLWTAATWTTPDLPRPRVNLAAAYLAQQDYSLSAWHGVRAIELSRVPRYSTDRWAVRDVVQAQLRWADLVSPTCSIPLYQPYC